ncbi:hypothetical protein N9L68_03930 [bacterium]|nr:hypothetical protein [bacterium]
MIACTLAPVDVSIDVTTHIPSTLAFVGFSGVENAGEISISGSNFTYDAGANISIGGSNTISCDLSPLTVSVDSTSYAPSSPTFTWSQTGMDGSALTIQAPTGGEQVSVSPGFGINVTGSGNTFSIQNTKPAPAYIVANTGGDNTDQQDVVTQLTFNGFNHAFGSNILTISPEPRDPALAGDGTRVSGQTVTTTRPMCDVAYFIGSTETVIPGNQIAALKFPQDQITYNWQPSSWVLQMYLPTPSSGTTSPRRTGQ